MSMKPERTITVDEMITENIQALDGWLNEDGNDSATKATITLAKALQEPWYKWIKESGNTGQDIVHALTRFTAAMICETAANTAKPGTENSVAEVMAKLIQIYVVAGMKNVAAQRASGDNTGFRKTDA